MPIWLADLRTSLVQDKLLQIVRLYTLPGTPATRQPGNAATPHRGFSYPLPTVMCSLLSPLPSAVSSRIHIRMYVHTYTEEAPSPDRVAEESSRKIASVSYTARSRACFYLPSENVDCNISLPLNRTRLSLSPSFCWTNVVQTDTIARSSGFLIWQKQKKMREDAFRCRLCNSHFNGGE